MKHSLTTVGMRMASWVGVPVQVGRATSLYVYVAVQLSSKSGIQTLLVLSGGLSPWVDVGATEASVLLGAVEVLSTGSTDVDGSAGGGAPRYRALQTWPAATLGRRRFLR